MALAAMMLLTLLWACVDTPRECEGYGSPEAVGTLENDELVEASGLAVSPEQAVVWSHNDKGDGARIFGVGLDGSDLGVWTLPGQILDDAEDIAPGWKCCGYFGALGGGVFACQGQGLSVAVPHRAGLGSVLLPRRVTYRPTT